MSTSSSTPDHGQRDQAIAINSYTTVVGRRAVPEERFRSYWRDVHGPLCSRVPGLGFYVQHHFAAQRDTHLWPLPAGVAPLPDYDLDGAVEIGWASAGDQADFQDASHILFSDEQNVFEETAAYTLPDGSTTIVDRDANATPNGADSSDRLHVHFSPVPGKTDELMDHLLGAFAARAVASPDVVKVRVHAPEPHDNSAPNPPAPNVAHTMPDGRIDLVVLEIAFVDSLARRRFTGSDEHQAHLSDIAPLVIAVTAFPVSGVFTFVRDGALTTAGLRGSRVAELIGDLAAANQVSDEVQHLMRTGRPAD
jgi:hypothetical protein